MIDADKIVKIIEKQKEDRSKCIFYFTMTLTSEEKKLFRKGLKELINNINQSSNNELETEE